VLRNDRSLIFIGVEFQRCKSIPPLVFDVSPGQFSGNSGLRSVEPVISAITAAALAEAVVLDEASVLD